MSALAQAVQRVSPQDDRTHWWFLEREETTARAVCALSAPADQLAEPTEDSSRCLACLITRGHASAEEHGRAAPHGAVWQPCEV